MLLSPYRVLDLTDETGHLCGKMLGDLGADVVKIESPEGDASRKIGPFHHDLPDPEKSLYWFVCNASKRGITLNLEAADGRKLLEALARTADCLVESFPPGYLDRLGVGWSRLAELNPRLVLVSITPFGQDGPYRDFRICDLTAQALGGMMDVCGEANKTPMIFGGPENRQAYFQAGAQSAAGAMTALYSREMTGEGQHVDVSIAEAMTWASGEHWLLMEWELTRIKTSRTGNSSFRGNVTVRVCFPCKDGYISTRLFVGVQGHLMQRLVEWMDSEGMAGEMKGIDWPRLDLLNLKQAEVDRWEDLMSRFFRKHTRDELQEQAVKRQLSLFPVNETRDLLANPQLASRKFWTKLEMPGAAEPLPFPGGAYVSTHDPPTVTRRAPLIGEHNVDILGGELGLSRDRLSFLKQSGVV